MSAIAEVKKLPTNASEIPAMLRRLAADIESGAVQAECVLAILEADPVGRPVHYIWGAARPLAHCAGLHIAVAHELAAALVRP
jgi:hypothetical protein